MNANTTFPPDWKPAPLTQTSTRLTNPKNSKSSLTACVVSSMFFLIWPASAEMFASAPPYNYAAKI